MTSERRYYVYLLASRIGGTLYVGMTNDLVRRVHEHKSGAIPGFTKTHGVDRLVWFEQLDTAEAAIRREKRVKRYNRAWKVRLIEERNPDWVDLHPSIAGA